MKTGNFLKTIISAAIIASLTACGGSDSDDGSTTDPVTVIPSPDDFTELVHAMDLTDTQGIFITGDSAATTIAAVNTTRSLTASAFSSVNSTATSTDVYEANTAYKIMSDGTIEELTIQDSSGADVERGTITIGHIIEVTDNYKIIYMNSTDVDAIISIPFLLQNDTGRLYSLEDVIDTVPHSSKSGFVYDNIADFYAVESANGELFLDYGDNVQVISQPSATDGSLTATKITDIVGSWTITQDGEYILYGAGNDYSSDTDDVFAVNLKTQARYDMNALIGEQLNTGTVSLDASIIHTFDGNTYLYYSHNGCTAYQITTGTDGLPSVIGEYEFVNTGETKTSFEIPTNDNGGTLCINDLALEQISVGGDVYYKDSAHNVLAINWSDKTFTNITDHNTKQSSGNSNVAPLDLSQVNDKNLILIKAGSVSVVGDYIYRTGTFSESTSSWEIVEDGSVSMYYRETDEVALERVNVETGETTVFFSQSSDYVLSSINIIPDGTLYVTGNQLSTGAAFMGTMTESGVITVTSSSGSYDMPEIITLVLINATDFISVDGNPSDWSIDLRTLTDEADDQITGDTDLTFYSATTGNGYYYGLIEHTGDITDDATVELSLSNGGKLIKVNNSFTHIDSDTNEVTTSNLNYAQGFNFEFKMDLSDIGETTTVTGVSITSSDGTVIDTM